MATYMETINNAACAWCAGGAQAVIIRDAQFETAQISVFKVTRSMLFDDICYAHQRTRNPKQMQRLSLTLPQNIMIVTTDIALWACC